MAEVEAGGNSNGLVNFGYPALDSITGPMRPGHLVVVAARPGVGKTALANGAAWRIACSVGPVAYFSLEMTRAELVGRIVAEGADVPYCRMTNGGLTPDEQRRVEASRDLVENCPLYIDDSPSLTVPMIRARSRRLQAERGLALVVVDHVGLVHGVIRRRDQRHLEVGEIAHGLKSLAKELGVPVMALSQLNRAPETRKDSRPVLADLRESGDIEQDADLVLMLYRDRLYNPDSLWGDAAEAIVRKNRHGRTGTALLAWNGPNMAFRNLNHETAAPAEAGTEGTVMHSVELPNQQEDLAINYIRQIMDRLDIAADVASWQLAEAARDIYRDRGLYVTDRKATTETKRAGQLESKEAA